MEAALVAVRFVQFAAAMVLLGAPAFALGLGYRFPASSAVRRDFDRWLRRWLLVAVVAALVSAALLLDLEAVIMGDGWFHAFDPHTIALVLFETLFGQAWCWHIGFGVALLGLILVSARRPGFVVPITILAAAFVASLAWAGHAVMLPGASHLLVQGIHLLSGALWLGSLPALLYLLTRARRERTPDWQDALAYMLPLYSKVGYGAVALVVLSGVFNSWFLVRSVGNLVTTSFGRVLVVKIVLVLLMIGIAGVNRWVFLPKLDRKKISAVRALEVSVAVDLVTGGMVVAAVSLLGTLTPAMGS
jgi:copper resistance protein D